MKKEYIGEKFRLNSLCVRCGFTLKQHLNKESGCRKFVREEKPVPHKVAEEENK